MQTTEIYRFLDMHQPFFACHISKRAKSIVIKTFLHRRTSEFHRYLRVGFDCVMPTKAPRFLLWIPSHIQLLRPVFSEDL